MDIKCKISMAFNFQKGNVCPIAGLLVLQINIILLQAYTIKKSIFSKTEFTYACAVIDYSMG